MPCERDRCKYKNHVADKRSLGERGGRMNHRGEFLAVGGERRGIGCRSLAETNPCLRWEEKRAGGVFVQQRLCKKTKEEETMLLELRGREAKKKKCQAGYGLMRMREGLWWWWMWS